MIRHDLRPQLGDPRDQGDTPSCLSYALSAAHQHARSLHEALSAEYLHYYATGGRRAYACSPAAALGALESAGQPFEREQGEPAAASWTPPSGLKVYKHRGKLAPATVEAVEHHLEAGRVPVLGVVLTRSFYYPASPWVMKPEGPLGVGHAVAGVATGEVNGRRAILIRNSWGTSWADAGHAWLDEEFLSRHLLAVMVLTEAVA